MRVTVARLRQGIVVLAGLLMVVLAGFFLYGRYRFRHFEKDLPGKLGINVLQTADGYTVSQSTQGHTLYTIHASKIQYTTGGHATLHQVEITLYGTPGSNRTDKIYGSDFDYDKANGVVTAHGEVQIDLSGLGGDGGAQKAAAPTSGPASRQGSTQSSGQAQNQGSVQQGEDGGSQQNIIHIKTSGLTFDQKSGDASTQQYAEFSLPKAAGNSTGASYNSKTGLLVLDSDVTLTTSNNGNLAVVHATHATLLRDSKQAFLLHPMADYETEKSSADQAIVYFRKDGSASSIESQGHVKMTTDSGAVLTAGTSVTQLDEKSQPVKMDAAGGVNFVSNDENRNTHGTAISCTVDFGANTVLKHAQCRDAVSFVEQLLKLPDDPKGTASRQMQASKLDIDFVPGPDGKKSIAQKALATGSAQVNLHTVPSKGNQQSTNISGDQLLATLNPEGTAIRQLDGAGSTKIVDLAQDGSTNTSSGDRLHMTFVQEPKTGKEKPAEKKGATTTSASASGSLKNASKDATGDVADAAKKGENKEAETSQIDTAIQDGHVMLTQTPAKKADAKQAPATLTAWAEHAEYHSSDQVLHLTGSPRLKDGDALQMAAQAIDYHRDSGDATGQGSLKATYRQQAAQAQTTAGPAPGPGAPDLGGSGPVFITADHGELHHATNVSVFYGTMAVPARMWQSDHSIAAPVLEVTQNPQTLKAYGAEGNTLPAVSANLASNLGAKHQPSVVRIHSRTLDYSDADRRGDFRGAVTAENPDGVIHADQAQVFLDPKSSGGSNAPKPQGAKSGQQDSSQIDHIVATGNVVMTQPGRKASGDKLVYTTDDGKYVLTGTAGNLPRVVDQVKGTTTGARLIFNSQDDSVVVSGGPSSAVTETRTPK